MDYICTGPAVPAQPIDLQVTHITSELAVVEWLITDIMYTPETFTVLYGINQNSLNSSSEVVNGTKEIDATNQLYSATLTNLRPDTTYFYQVVTTNDVGMNASSIAEFSTSSPGQKHSLNCYSVLYEVDMILGDHLH